MWTSHGHQIIGTIAEDPVLSNRPPVARCMGPDTCKACSQEASNIRKQLGLDEFGRPNIPVLDETADDARKFGRVRMALLQTRPTPEVDLICNWLETVISEHKVLMEAHNKRQP